MSLTALTKLFHSPIAAFDHLSLHTKVTVLVVVVFAGFALSSVSSYYSGRDAQIGGSLYHKIQADYAVLEKVALLRSSLAFSYARAVGSPGAGQSDSAHGDMPAGVADFVVSLRQIVDSIEVEDTRKPARSACSEWQKIAGAPRSQTPELLRRGYDACDADLRGVSAAVAADVSILEKSAVASTSAQLKWIYICVFAVFAVVCLILVIISRGLSRQMGAGVWFAQTVAAGDLSEELRVCTKRDFGLLAAALNEMVAKLRSAILKTRDAAGRVLDISSDLANSTVDLTGAVDVQRSSVAAVSTAVAAIAASVSSTANGVESLSLTVSDNSSALFELTACIEEVASHADAVAQSVEDVSSAVTELASSTSQVSSSAQFLTETAESTASAAAEMAASVAEVKQLSADTTALSERVQADAASGRDAVHAVISGMAEIHESSKVTSLAVSELERRSAEIGQVSTVISNFAAESNLLALNALIISAQAGEHGKGFAVVANSVKDLAIKTNAATANIAQLVKNVQAEVQRVASAAAGVTKSVDDGELLSRHAGAVLETIVDGSRQSVANLSLIARAMDEQATSSGALRSTSESLASMAHQLGTATTEQSQTVNAIRREIDQIRSRATELKRSTREQTETAKTLSESMERIAGVALQFKSGCQEQASEAEQILLSVQEFESTVDSTGSAAKISERAVMSLLAEVEDLQRNVGGFKVSHEE